MSTHEQTCTATQVWCQRQDRDLPASLWFALVKPVPSASVITKGLATPFDSTCTVHINGPLGWGNFVRRLEHSENAETKTGCHHKHPCKTASANMFRPPCLHSWIAWKLVCSMSLVCCWIAFWRQRLPCLQASLFLLHGRLTFAGSSCINCRVLFLHFAWSPF